MWRPTIITVITWRTKPTTAFSCPRCLEWITWDNAEWTWNEATYTWDNAFTWWIQTAWDSPRKEALLELENWTNIELENNTLLQAEWWIKSNVIDTQWA